MGYKPQAHILARAPNASGEGTRPSISTERFPASLDQARLRLAHREDPFWYRLQHRAIGRSSADRACSAVSVGEAQGKSMALFGPAGQPAVDASLRP